MHLENIKIKNFRNYDELSMDFSKNLNIISGLNASGKTNLIEAIYMGCFSKGFRSSKDTDLIKIKENFTRVHLDFYQGERLQNIEILIDKKKKKKVYLNESEIKNMQELLNRYKCVLFSPEDLRLIDLGPNLRRKFLNREISQIDSSYYLEILKFNKILKQRNSSIKLINKREKKIDFLRMWDEIFAETASKISIKRNIYLKNIGKIAQIKHKSISKEKENLKISYLSDYNSIFEEKYDKIVGEILSHLENDIEKDLKYGFTSRGPHKDDFEIYINQKKARDFASQGQKRSAALSIRLSQLDLIEEKSGFKPILLLDDVSSELDSVRRKYLLQNLKDKQVFISTTNVKEYDEISENFRSIVIKDGKIIKNKEEYLGSETKQL